MGPFRGILAILLLLSALSATTGVAKPTLDSMEGIPETNLIFPILYMKNIMARFVLESYGKDDAQKVRIMRLGFQTLRTFAAQKRMMMLVDSNKDLAEVRRIYSINGNTLEDEIRNFESGLIAPWVTVTLAARNGPDMERQIEKLWEREQAIWLGGNLLGSRVEWLEKDSVFRKYLFLLLDNGYSQYVPAPSADEILSGLHYAHLAVRKALERMNSTGDMIAESSFADTMDPGDRRFFQIVIGEYFRRLDIDSKKDIMRALFDHMPEDPTDLGRFEQMVINSGPQFQKLFQVYARLPGMAPGVSTIFKRLESSARPGSWAQVRAAILAQKVPFEWVKIDPNPIGVGTMAECHVADIRWPDGSKERVLVRILKPGIQRRLERDNRILVQVAKVVDEDPLLLSLEYPKISPFIEDVINMGLYELIVNRTVEGQRLGIKYYTNTVSASELGPDGKISFSAPGIIEIGPNDTMMVQELVKGESFSKFKTKYPVAAKAVVRELARLWIDQAFLGSGYFNADLHQGNLLLENNRGNKDKIVTVKILDYGMTDFLTPNMQAHVMALGLIIATEDIKTAAKALWEISIKKQNSIKLKELEVFMTAELKRVKSLRGTEAKISLEEWIASTASAGIRYPEQLASLNRGLKTVGKMLESLSGDAADEVSTESILSEELRRHPTQLYKVLAKVKSIAGATRPVTWLWNSLAHRFSPKGSIRSCKNYLLGKRSPE